VRREYLVAEVGRQFMPVHRRDDDRRQHRQQPQHHSKSAENRPQQRPAAIQEGVGIPQRDADRHRVDEALQQFLALLLATTLGEFVNVGWQFGLQQVASVQLRQQADHFVLRRGVLAGFGGDLGPHLVDRALAVHQLDDSVRGRAETMQLARSAIVQHVPRLATKALTMDARMCAQFGAQLGDTIPGGAEERGGHGCQRPTATRSRPACAASRSGDASRSTHSSVRRH